MKKQNILLPLLLIAIVASTILFRNHSEKEAEKAEFEEENEERPYQPISEEENALLIDYIKSRENQVMQKSAVVDNKSSYANGKLTGTWNYKIPHTSWNGYRVDNSAYDSLRNIFYTVSYAGHLYKLEYQDEVKWTLLNSKVQMNPSNNSSANPVFMGTLLQDSTFRLIRSNDASFRMEYSDNEGVSWNIATGARVTESWSNQAFEITNNGQKVIVLHTYDSNYHHLYFSFDNGKTYTASKLNYPISTYDVRIAKPFYTNDAYLWVWGKNTKRIGTYKYNPANKDFELVINSTSNVAGTNLSSAAASYYNGTLHFYLSTINSNYTIYYSNDGGITWTQKNSGRDRPFATIVPNKPNILLSGFEDINVSSNYGVSWNSMGHKIGWDLQHMNTYEMSGGKTITLAGLDFGCYVSQTPQSSGTYKWCNNGAFYAMHYDAASSENFNTIYMANQDRGTTAYLDSTTNVNTVDVDGTDVLRVCYANRESSVWTWFYYGRIKHRFNFATGKSGETSYDGLGNWWAAPIIASPNPNEDAIYAAYGSNLQKFSYNSQTSSITKTAHPFNFKTKYGSELGGFGYSKLNRELWYAALNNGTFVYSKDAGSTWTKSLYIGPQPRANDQSYNYQKNQIAIKASAIDTNKVYYAGVGRILLISDNGGKTFSPKSRGLNVYRIRDFALSPDEKFIFAACGYGGAWVYSVENDYWYQMKDDPIPTVDFTDVQFINRKNCVRFSSYGSGIIEFSLDQTFYDITAPDKLTASFTEKNQIDLKWTDKADDEDGFYIEKATDGDFICIDTIAANVTSYVDTDVAYDQTCYYRVKAYKSTATSYHSNLAFITVPPKGYLNQSNWTLVEASSEETVGEYAPAKYAFDNNTSTFWHTAWKNSQPSHPHHIIIDLGKESTVAGFRYLPRQDGNLNGSIAKYEFYVTNDLTNWGTPKTTGTFAAGSNWKESMFNSPTTGRYVKLIALSEINGKIYTSASEIAVLYQQVPPAVPVNFTANILQENNIVLRWKDNSINASGFIIEQLIDNQFIAVDSASSGSNSYLLADLMPSTYTYRLRAFNSGGTSDPTNTLSVKIDISGINSLHVDWNVYPNPCTDIVNIELSSLSDASVLRIINLNGKIIETKHIAKGMNSIQIDFSKYNPGLYVFELTSGNKRTTTKITKQ